MDSGLIIRRKILEPVQDLSIRPEGLCLKRIIFQLLQRSRGCPASLGLLVRPFKAERSRSRDLLRLVLLVLVAGKVATMRGEARKVRPAWVTQPPIRVSFDLFLCICQTVVFQLLLLTLNSSPPELLDKRIVCQVEISAPPADEVAEPVEPVLDRLLHQVRAWADRDGDVGLDFLQVVCPISATTDMKILFNFTSFQRLTMRSPVVVESYGSFSVVGIHPGEEDPAFDDVASKKSRGGWVRGRAEDCACGQDAFQAFFACVVVEYGGRGNLVNSDSTPAPRCVLCNMLLRRRSRRRNTEGRSSRPGYWTRVHVQPIVS